MSQLTLEKIGNMNLFSNHYLENLIQRNPEWKRDDHEKAFHRIKQIYQREISFLEGLNESQLEERFFKKIFKVVLPDFEVQATTETADFPDYAFFPDRKTLDNAHKEKGKKSFYTDAFAIGEVKKWSAELDRFGRDKHNKRRNPSFQIWLYLHETEPKWGILSNGRKWRLYHQDKPLDYYYEIDLIALLETDDIEGFRYFYYFFRREAFLPSEEQDAFLNRVLKESADYAKEIGDNLKENIYRAMKIIADGFLHWPQNNLDSTRGDIRTEVQASTMRLLYRFLFLLYAEGKGLLSLKDEQYRRNHSFYRIKKEIAERKGGPSQDHYSPASTSLWSNLKDLFRLIDQGSEAFGISKNQFHVPTYNGGLFEAKRNPNLERWTIGDTYLADAIDLLARSKANGGEMAFVDYSTLEIQHLGSIYEGLLEYKLKIAETDLVVKGGRKKREWVTLEEYNKGRNAPKNFEDFDKFDRVRIGKLYLATEKGERKATGSYYTPDFIVNYIVENTVGPVVKEKWKNAREKEESFVDTTLSIKVLDPAMGSGHFLVGAIEFLAGKLLEAAQKDIEAGLVEDDDHFTADWAKREVVSHCIYGVDLNYLAVELAKVSLWLSTISKDKPLSFLDHRLKQGNSLIGADLEDLPWHPFKKRDKDQRRLDIPEGFIKKLVDTIREIAAISDDTLEDIRKKEEIFEHFKGTLEYDMIKTLADVRTSIYFGNEIDENTYGRYTGDAFWSSESQWKDRREKYFVKKAIDMGEEKNFFHWELEFPEIFFKEGRLKGNPGFDGVIGNPPYVRIYRGALDKEDIKFWKRRFISAHMKFDLYVVFMELSLNLLRKKGYFSMIVPDKFMNTPYGEPLREKILNETQIDYILDLRETNVFDDASVSNVIPVLKKEGVEDSIFSVLIQKDAKLIETNKIPQMSIKSSPDNSFRLTKSIEDESILTKIEKQSIPFERIYYVNWGLRTGTEEKTKEFVVQSSEHPLAHPMIRGENVSDRYNLVEPAEYIIYEKESLYNPMFEELFENEKIVFRKISGKRGLMAVLDEQNYYCFSTLIPCINLNSLPEDKQRADEPTEESRKYTSHHFIMSNVNSRLVRWYYDKNLSDKLSVVPNHIRKLPIPCINFNTLKQERKELVEEGKRLYYKYLESNEMTTLIDFFQQRLPKDKDGNFIAEKEQSDAVHDILAYLAEQMMEMNKAKNKEINGFLEWLETELGASIETLTNRTKLKEFYDLDFDGVLSILKKNKKNIPVNVSGRDFQNNLRREFEKSLDGLSPLRKRIDVTDKLIDQIVYKLYGLTEEEIGVVEGSI